MMWESDLSLLDSFSSAPVVGPTSEEVVNNRQVHCLWPYKHPEYSFHYFVRFGRRLSLRQFVHPSSELPIVNLGRDSIPQVDFLQMSAEQSLLTLLRVPVGAVVDVRPVLLFQSPRSILRLQLILRNFEILV